MNKAVFFDRDGVINKAIFRNGNYHKPIAPWSLNEFSLIPGINDPILNLKNFGFKLFVVTNQPDIAKGIIDFEFVVQVKEIILKELPIDEIMVCPHVDEDMCECRKPKPGMILSLAKKWDIDFQSSFLIGDGWKDIEAGKTAGSTTLLLEREYNNDTTADFNIMNLAEAVEIINQFHNQSKE